MDLAPSGWTGGADLRNPQKMPKMMDPTLLIVSILGYWAIFLGTLEIQTVDYVLLILRMLWDIGAMILAILEVQVGQSEILASLTFCHSPRYHPLGPLPRCRVCRISVLELNCGYGFRYSTSLLFGYLDP